MGGEGKKAHIQTVANKWPLRGDVNGTGGRVIYCKQSKKIIITTKKYQHPPPHPLIGPAGVAAHFDGEGLSGRGCGRGVPET